MSEGGGETPYEQAKRLQAEGHGPAEVLAALRSAGVGEEDAQIAARAARGEAGVALDLKEAPPPPVPLEPPAEAPTHPCPQHAAWPVLGACERCGTFYCRKCLVSAERPTDSKRCPACLEKPEPQGIGGWLILPAIGLVLTPLTLTASLIQDLQALSEDLMPGVATPVALEALSNLALLLFGLVCAVNFFQKKRLAVPLMIGFYAAGMVSVVINAGLSAWVASVVGSEASSTDAASVRGFGTSVIWIVYFLQSKRVKATFVL